MRMGSCRCGCVGFVKCSLLISLLLEVSGDIYLHNPRGSNNRLKEPSAQRTNANRVFDSQNNNRGGYNVGDRTKSRASTEAEQYQMAYFQSSPIMSGTNLLLQYKIQSGQDKKILVKGQNVKMSWNGLLI